MDLDLGLIKMLLDKLRSSIDRMSLARKDWLMMVLCVLLVAMATMSGYGKMGWYLNAIFIAKLELVFIILYFIILRDFPRIIEAVKQHVLMSLLVVLWLSSMLISLLTSRYFAENQEIVFGRLTQTILHLVFFLFVMDFFRRYRPEFTWVYVAVVVSSLLIILRFFMDYHWFDKYWIGDRDWVSGPPVNAHIKYVGYQVLAAASFIMYFVIRSLPQMRVGYLKLSAYVAVIAFLFWLGGRGAIVSYFIMLGFVFLSIYKIEGHSWYYIKMNFGLIVLAFLLSELFSVFSWNGMVNQILKTYENLDTLQGVTTNRTLLWKTTIHSLAESPIFGLGPQSYYLMENRVWGVQPHNSLLQFSIEWGLVGAFLITLILARGFLYGFRMHILNNDSGCIGPSISAGAVIVSLLAHSIVDGTLFFSEPLVYLSIAYAIWLTDASSEKRCKTLE